MAGSTARGGNQASDSRRTEIEDVKKDRQRIDEQQAGGEPPDSGTRRTQNDRKSQRGKESSRLHEAIDGNQRPAKGSEQAARLMFNPCRSRSPVEAARTIDTHVLRGG